MCFINKDFLVTKSNTLIHSRYELSLEEQRIILTLASMVQPNDESFKIYRMSVQEFSCLIGVESNNRYTKLRKATRSLMTKVFEIETDNEYIQIAWLSSCKYIKNSGMVELKFSDELKPYLLQLKGKFTSYYLGNVLQMKSKYSIRLYEIFKSEEWRNESTIELDTLKSILKCENYDKWQNFKQRVLEPAIKEINKRTDLFVDYQPVRNGRKVETIQFVIRSSSAVDAEMYAVADWQETTDANGTKYFQGRCIK